MQDRAKPRTNAGGSSKATDRLLSRLKSLLEAGDMTEVGVLLSGSLGPDFFTRMREQKLLLRAPADHRAAFAEILRSASQALGPVERATFGNYLTFALEVQGKRERCIEQLHAGFRAMSRCSLVDLLVVSEEVLEWFIDKQLGLVEANPAGLSVNEYERRVHDRNGAALDIAMAVARAVNEYGRVALGPPDGRQTRAQRRKTAHLMRQATALAGQANSLEFFFDSVTYGEFAVEMVDGCQEPTFRLHYIDARRNLLKSLAIRRTLARKNAQHANARFVREELKKLEEPLLKQAVVDYIFRAGTSKRAVVDLDKALRASRLQLLGVEAEDDLLLAASRMDKRTLAYYVVGMALRWYALAAAVVRDAPQVRARSLSAATISLDDIASRIQGLDAEHMSEAFDSLTSDFPARSHVALMDLPFIKDGAGVVRPFLNTGTTSWTCAVRKALIQGGAIGKSVGAVWEDFSARSFENTDWKVVGQAIKLRERGETLTDVDLLLLRQDLLLVMQIKGLIGANNTPYDHWRNREAVRVGCAQARLAARFLEVNRQTLVAVCGKHLAANIRHIQPVVLTNIDELDGWRVDGVPVIGEVTRKAICRGARVDYQRGEEVVHTHHFVRPEDLNTTTILQLFDETVEMRVAMEGTQTTHSSHRIGGLTLQMPEFVAKPDAHQMPRFEALAKQGRRQEQC